MRYGKKFYVLPGSKVDLKEVDAGFTDKHETHQDALAEIEAHNRKLHDLQYLMYAEGKRSLLIVLQGRDAAGKDGTINHVLGAMNPQGCPVTGFKVPSKEEMEKGAKVEVIKASEVEEYIAKEKEKAAGAPKE